MMELGRNKVEFKLRKVSTRSDKPVRNYKLGALTAPTCVYQRPQSMCRIGLTFLSKNILASNTFKQLNILQMFIECTVDFC